MFVSSMVWKFILTEALLKFLYWKENLFMFFSIRFPQQFYTLYYVIKLHYVLIDFGAANSNHALGLSHEIELLRVARNDVSVTCIIRDWVSQILPC